MDTTTSGAWLESIERISVEIIAPAAAEIDAAGAFPRAAIKAMGKAGLLGLVSGKEVGGLGEGHRADGDGRLHALLRRGCDRVFRPARSA